MKNVLLALTCGYVLCACNAERDVGADSAGPSDYSGAHLLESVQDLLALPVGQGVSPASGFVPSGYATTVVRGDDQTVRISDGPLDVPVTVPVGTVIQGFAVALQDGGGTNVIKVEIVSSMVGVLGGITTQGAGLEQAWTTAWPSSARTTVGGEMLWFRLSPLVAGGGGGWTTVPSMIESLSLWSPAPQTTDELVIPAGQWTMIQGDLQRVPLSVGVWLLPNTFINELVHELVIPSGSTIRALRFNMNHNALYGAVRLKLVSRRFGQSSTTTTDAIVDNVTTGTTWAIRDLIASPRSGVPYQTVSGTTYWLSVITDGQAGLSDGPVLFDGVSISYMPPN